MGIIRRIPRPRAESKEIAKCYAAGEPARPELRLMSRSDIVGSGPAGQYDGGMGIRLMGIMLLACVAAGCGGRGQHFDVFVRNHTSDPITIGMTKDGGRFEVPWASPEEVAMRTWTHDEPIWGTVIPPGGMLQTEERGQVGGNVHAWLRAYRGRDLTLEDLLAIGRDSPNRADARLNPGENTIVITDEQGQLTATRQRGGQ
jgi:hypothetical protein